MEKDSEKRLLKINCLDPARRQLARFLALSAPIWALFMPSCLLMRIGKASYFNYASATDPYLILGYASVLFSPLALILCAGLLRRNFAVSEKYLQFPGFQIGRFALSKLKKVELASGRLKFQFGGFRKNIGLDLDRVSEQDRLKLAACLQDILPGSVFSRDCIAQIESFQNPNLEPVESVEIAYDSHFKSREFCAILSGHERKIWLFWGILWLFLGLLDAQMIYNLFAGCDMQLTAPGRVLFEVFNHTGESCVSLIKDNNALAGSLVLLSLVFLGAIFLGLTKANRLRLDKQGIELSFVLGSFRFRRALMKWSDCFFVEMGKDDQEKSISNRNLFFWGKERRKLLLKISPAALPKPLYRTLIRNCAAIRAPQAELDAAFLESSEPVQRQTYTELWLQSLSSPPKRDRLAPLSPGDYLQSGAYRVLELLGAGGQGIAYLAECLDRTKSGAPTVVIKEFMMPVYVNRKARQSAVERFENESKLLASMQNDRIVGLEDHFIEDHRAYLVLEHVKGKSLRKIVEEAGPLSDEMLEGLFPQFCEILDYLHGLSPPLVHRDFTPDNLILDDSGNLKLIDFNVARQAVDSKSSMVVGKHAYMPPEQFAGRAEPQSDLYALGATLYFLLSGEEATPFSQSGSPAGRHDLFGRWQKIISSCTSLELEKRASSAAALLELFNSCQAQSEKIKLDELEKLPSQ